MLEQIPEELNRSASGIAGSLLALFFMRRPPMEKFGIFLGGCLLAHFGGQLMTYVLDLKTFEGAVGFLVGLLGMRLVEKVYEMIEVIDLKDLWVRLLKRVGLGGEA